jgi:hypothetical protein
MQGCKSGIRSIPEYGKEKIVARLASHTVFFFVFWTWKGKIRFDNKILIEYALEIERACHLVEVTGSRPKIIQGLGPCITK